MNAPDKLFVHTGKLGLLCVSKINITGDDTEYIRKDALVKWFTERKEKREAVAEKSNDDFDRGMAYAYQKTLEKIESL